MLWIASFRAHTGRSRSVATRLVWGSECGRAMPIGLEGSCEQTFGVIGAKASQWPVPYLSHP